MKVGADELLSKMLDGWTVWVEWRGYPKTVLTAKAPAVMLTTGLFTHSSQAIQEQIGIIIT